MSFVIFVILVLISVKATKPFVLSISSNCYFLEFTDGKIYRENDVRAL